MIEPFKQATITHTCTTGFLLTKKIQVIIYIKTLKRLVVLKDYTFYFPYKKNVLFY